VLQQRAIHQKNLEDITPVEDIQQALDPTPLQHGEGLGLLVPQTSWGKGTVEP